MTKLDKPSLSWKEKKILRELDLNARQSASSIGNKIHMSKQVVKYNLENMIKKGVIKEFITYIDTEKLGYTFYNVFIKMKYTSNEERRGITNRLKSIPNIVWLVSLRGEWQMIISTLAKDIAEFSLLLEEILNVLKGKLLDYSFFIVINASQLGYKSIYASTGKGYNYQAKVGRKDIANLSENDLKVLKLVSNHARLSNVEIARKTKMTLEKVRYSLKKLERDKVIQGFKPLLDMFKLGYLWHLMFLRLKSSTEKQKEELIDYLKSLPQVFYVIRGVGNCNLTIEFQTKNLDELEKIKDIIATKFSNLIADEKTVQLIEEHKCTYFPGSLI
ncbi:MAG TPA: Lrp/AsnC family transcriptional regulator [Candidatus Nanoarchaeia archaeon]|nr:Lrp/AsnC family transcriptional regulator [Candidatus Nanoarchaeia archaeon]